MSAPAPALTAARPPQPERRLTHTMRVALGFMHVGALYREANNVWRSRAFQEERVLDKTVRALEAMGLARLQEYAAMYGLRRVCATVTPAGMLVYRGGRFADRRPPPVQAEAILREVEGALGLLTQESEQLARQQKAANDAALAARQQQARATQALDRIEKRLAELARIRASLDARRVDLRCLVAEAAERMMGGEAGR